MEVIRWTSCIVDGKLIARKMAWLNPQICLVSYRSYALKRLRISGLRSFYPTFAADFASFFTWDTMFEQELNNVGDVLWR